MNTVANEQERRQAERVEISQLIHLGLFREEWIHAKVVDISRTGFRFQSEEEIDPGSEMYVQLDVDSDQVMATAIIVHTRTLDDGTFEAGCEFTRFQGPSKSRLETYLDAMDG